MDINKLPISISLSLFLFCASAFAEPFQVSSVNAEQSGEVSLAATFQPGLEVPPKPDDFDLFDGTKAIKSINTIEPFESASEKLVLLICVDVSLSLPDILIKEIKDALINSLSMAMPKDKKDKYIFGLVSFADKVVISSDFTDDIEVLKNSIRELKRLGSKETLLYSAINDSLMKLRDYKPTEYRRILVISDGNDEGSIETFDTVVNLSEASGIPIDGIGIADSDKKLDDGLSGLVKATGGRYIYIHPKQKSLSLKDALDGIINSFIENTWVVNLKYEADTEKPKLENAIVKFKMGNSAIIPTAIPAPKEIPQVEPLPGDASGKKEPLAKESSDNILIYLAGGILLLATLLYLFWTFDRRKEPADKMKTVKKDPDFQAAKSIKRQPYSNEPPPQSPKGGRRLTEVGSIINVHHQQQQDSSNIVLEITDGPLDGNKILINKPHFRIGARQDNDLVLMDDYVSGHHALLSYENGKLFLSDLNSRNGTFLNGQAVKDKTITVSPGDAIRIGVSTLKVKSK